MKLEFFKKMHHILIAMNVKDFSEITREDITYFDDEKEKMITIRKPESGTGCWCD